MVCTTPGSVGDGLVEKFFGKNKDLRLTVDQFKEFHTQLLEEVMKLEVRYSTHTYTHTYMCVSRYVNIICTQCMS